jgi:potassium-transporting ATPase KdpC subunit
MKKTFLISFLMIIFMTIITGILYPLVITGISSIFLNDKAGGSLVKKDGIIIGSELIGQQFDSAIYFHSRPSAVDYQAIPSGASNLSWSDKRLQELVVSRKESFLKENSLPDTTSVPMEMLFASASGIDPHISPRAALLQVNRIALERNFSEQKKQDLVSLITKMDEKPQFSLFGEERINVFLLNLELDKFK